MGKPGPLEMFNSTPCSVDEFCDETIADIEAFRANMKHHNQEDRTMFNWFYLFGFWNEALEFRDEFPEIFDEWKLLDELTKPKKWKEGLPKRYLGIPGTDEYEEFKHGQT